MTKDSYEALFHVVEQLVGFIRCECAYGHSLGCLVCKARGALELAREAKILEDETFKTYNYSLDKIMELAGEELTKNPSPSLSVIWAVARKARDNA
jgi:hypothetical protein